jgi:hypothetical protein
MPYCSTGTKSGKEQHIRTDKHNFRFMHIKTQKERGVGLTGATA